MWQVADILLERHVARTRGSLHPLIYETNDITCMIVALVLFQKGFWRTRGSEVGSQKLETAGGKEYNNDATTTIPWPRIPFLPLFTSESNPLIYLLFLMILQPKKSKYIHGKLVSCPQKASRSLARRSPIRAFWGAPCFASSAQTAGRSPLLYRNSA
jgi:hypothetical protein